MAATCARYRRGVATGTHRAQATAARRRRGCRRVVQPGRDKVLVAHIQGASAPADSAALLQRYQELLERLKERSAAARLTA
jgi:hypothetical protein